MTWKSATGWVIGEQQHSFEVLKNKKCLYLLILPVLGSTRTKFFLSPKIFLTIMIKLHFTVETSDKKRLLNWTWAYGSKVFMKIHDNGNKEQIEHLSQLTRKFLDNILNVDY